MRSSFIRWSSSLLHMPQVHVTLLRQAEGQLKEAKQEAVRRNKEVDVQRGEVQRLQEELQKERMKMGRATEEQQSLRTYSRELRQELDELHSKHQEAGSYQPV